MFRGKKSTKHALAVGNDINNQREPLLLIEYLKNSKCEEVEGIFRISGENEQIKAISKQLKSNKSIDLSKFTLHSVAGALKQWFRELNDPVMTFQLYRTWLSAAEIEEEKNRLVAIKRVFRTLPVKNKDLLIKLIELLVAIDANSAANKMSADNLAIVFSPTLLRDKTDFLDPIKMITEQSQINKIIQYFICRYHWICLDTHVPNLFVKTLTKQETAFFNSLRQGSLELVTHLLEKQQSKSNVTDPPALVKVEHEAEEVYEPRSPRADPKSPRRSQLLGQARVETSSLKLEKQQEIQQKIEPNRKLLRQMLAISENDRKIVRNSVMLGENFKIENLHLSEPQTSLAFEKPSRLKRCRSSLPNNTSSLISMNLPLATALAPSSQATKSAGAFSSSTQSPITPIQTLNNSEAPVSETEISPSPDSQESVANTPQPEVAPIPSHEQIITQDQSPPQTQSESQSAEEPKLDIQDDSQPTKSESKDSETSETTELVESLGDSASSMVLGILNGDVDVVEEYVSFFDADECAEVHGQLSELMNKLYLQDDKEPPKLTDSFMMGLGITPDNVSLLSKESPI